MKYKILAITAPIVLILDQWSKWLITKNFILNQSKDIIPGFFSFTYVRNRGAAFSFLNSADPKYRDPFFIAMPILILIFLGFFFKKVRDGQNLAAFSLSLIASGAVGNLIDRLRLGFVVDFIHVHWKDAYHYPMFNIADSCIVVGAFLFWWSQRKQST